MSATIEECRAAHKLKEEIYFRHAAGCCWHVVLDDRNVENSHVEYTVSNVIRCPDFPRFDECVRIGPFILKMSLTQRRKLAAGGYEGK